MRTWLQLLSCALCATLLLGARAAAVHAATISYVGADVTTHDAWRTASTVKAFDADGNNIYGTAGYAVAFSPGGDQVVQPAFATWAKVSAASFYGGNATSTLYRSIDDPLGGPDKITGTWYGSNPTNNYISITATQASSFRVGVYMDNQDDASISPSSLTLQQTVGGAATSGSINNVDADRDGDWYFFDILNATAGNVFVLSGVNAAPHGSDGIGAISFDVVAATTAPEPGSLSIFSLVGLAAYFRRRAMRVAKAG